MGNERIAYIKSLEDEVLIEIEDILIKFCHDPSPNNIYIMTNSIQREQNIPNVDELNSLSNGMLSDICIFGHYHLFLDRIIKKKRFICPGSVGLPFDGDNRAHYMIFEITKGHIKTTECLVEYELEDAVNEFEKNDYLYDYPEWSNKLIKSLQTGHCYI